MVDCIEGCYRILHSEIELIDHLHHEHGQRLIIYKNWNNFRGFVYCRLKKILHYKRVLRKIG